MPRRRKQTPSANQFNEIGLASVNCQCSATALSAGANGTKQLYLLDKWTEGQSTDLATVHNLRQCRRLPDQKRALVLRDKCRLQEEPGHVSVLLFMTFSQVACFRFLCVLSRHLESRVSSKQRNWKLAHSPLVARLQCCLLVGLCICGYVSVSTRQTCWHTWRESWHWEWMTRRWRCLERSSGPQRSTKVRTCARTPPEIPTSRPETWWLTGAHRPTAGTYWQGLVWEFLRHCLIASCKLTSFYWHDVRITLIALHWSRFFSVVQSFCVENFFQAFFAWFCFEIDVEFMWQRDGPKFLLRREAIVSPTWSLQRSCCSWLFHPNGDSSCNRNI